MILLVSGEPEQVAVRFDPQVNLCCWQKIEFPGIKSLRLRCQPRRATIAKPVDKADYERENRKSVYEDMV
jgi:hypothetical protein